VPVKRFQSFSFSEPREAIAGVTRTDAT
jgi:hypothetical protein